MGWRRRFRRPLLITGASGFLGQHLVEQPGDWEVLAPTHDMLDLRRADQVADYISEWRPQAVAHLAYRKNRTDVVEISRNVAEAAQASGARLVHLSTDLVFPGRPEAYTEADTAAPAVDYGRDKFDAEGIVLTTAPGAVVVRTSLLYGTARPGPAQLDVRAAIDSASAMTFFTDEVRCPTHAADVAAAIVALAARTEVTGVLHLAGPRPMSRAEFAQLDAAWSNRSPAAVRTSSIAEQGIARPGHVVLDSTRASTLGLTCRDPHDALRPR